MSSCFSLFTLPTCKQIQPLIRGTKGRQIGRKDFISSVGEHEAGATRFVPAAPDRGCRCFQINGRPDHDIEETKGSKAATLVGKVFWLERELDEKTNKTENPRSME